MIALEGLPLPEDPGQSVLPSEDALVAWLLELRRDAPTRFAPLAELAGVPLAEVLASPFGLRAVALGVHVGATTVHRELRHPIDWSDDPRTEDADHGVWDRGRLHIGKYQAFLQDAPHVTYDPAHHHKWLPHEMLHRAASFFVSDDDFELYLGARLNELVPVAVWWGHDQFCRLDEDAFDREHSPHEPSLEEAKWLTESEDALRARVGRTRRWLAHGLEHVCSGLQAVAEECATRTFVPSPRHVPQARLDASSDALAYVVAHRARLQRVRAVVEPHAYTDLAEYVAHIEAVHRSLLFGPIAVDAASVKSAQQVRDGWDIALRAALRGEVEEGDMLALANGRSAFDLDLLGEGLESLAPRTLEMLDQHASGWIDELCESAQLRRRAPLADRVGAWFAETDLSLPAWLPSLFEFECAIADAAPDPRIDELAGPQSGTGKRSEPMRVVRSRSYRLLSARFDVAALHAGEVEAPPEGQFAWLIGKHAAEVHVVPMDPEVAEAWSLMAEPAALDTVASLLGPSFEVLEQIGVFARTR